MDAFLLGLRLTTNEIRKVLILKQREGNLSNDAMCIILKDLMSDFAEGAANEYAGSLAGMMMEKAQAKETEAEDDNTEDQT